MVSLIEWDLVKDLFPLWVIVIGGKLRPDFGEGTTFHKPMACDGASPGWGGEGLFVEVTSKPILGGVIPVITHLTVPSGIVDGDAIGPAEKVVGPIFVRFDLG